MTSAVPDPGSARSLDDLVERLRALKAWAGEPSYEVLTARVNALWSADGRPSGELARRGTVVDCFKPGRRRVNTDLFVALVRALRDDAGYLAQWHQALRVVIGEARAAAQVRAQQRLPADVPGFTGRAGELDRLRQALRRRRAAGGAVVISAIEGMGGVGKTVLAVHAGHLLAAAEPFEHVLFVNLRGFHPDPAQPPADPAAVLDSFLRLLGVPGQEIPHDLAARADLFRQRVSGPRTLVVLDNAADEHQVRPLLPDSPSCVTLITSRRALTALEEATHLAVDVFTPDEALEFLRHAVLDVPVGDDPEALRRVALRCGYLPLALSLVAAQMRGTPGWTLTDHADRLDERHRHRRLDSGVEVALGLSYQAVPPARQLLLRLLALHPGQDVDAYAAAALADTDLDTAGEHLRQLGEEHLLQQSVPGRYGFHDLVRAYAADRASDEDRPPARRAALTRLFDHYLHAAASAMDALHPAERNRRPRVAEPATPIPAVADPDAARSWLDTECANLLAVAVHAAERGWPGHATRLAATLFRYLDTGGRYADAVTVHTHARRAAREAGDRAAEAQALTHLGNVHGRLGRYQEAVDHFRPAVALFQEAADRQGEARARGNLGLVLWMLGDYREAADAQREALALCRELGDRFGEAVALTNLGNVYERTGDPELAADHHCRAVDTFRNVGDRFGEAAALIDLGAACERLGRYAEAANRQQEALAIFREIGDRIGIAATLTNLGAVYQRWDQYDDAAEHHRQALALYREIGDRGGETLVLNRLGGTLLAAGRPDEAVEHHAAALALAEQTGDRYELANAHSGLGRTRHALGDAEAARHHWRLALAGYTELGVPEAAEVQASLAALEPSG